MRLLSFVWQLHRIAGRMALSALVAVTSLAGAQGLDAAGDGQVPIYAIQGDGPVSPYRQRRVDTYGVVTAVTPTGFYLQDATGDGRVATSDGIFVYTRERPAVAPTDCVSVAGALVEEFYEKTELSRVKALSPAQACARQLPVAVPLPDLAFGAAPAAHYEHLEGMRVSLRALAGVVQGPTKRFANGDVEVSLLPGRLAPYVEGGRVHQAQPEAMASLLYLSGALGVPLPDANWGDELQVAQAEAVLDYNFGKYQLLLLPGADVAHRARPRLGEAAAPAAADEFTVCSFNLYGMGQGLAQYPDPVVYAEQLDRRARQVADVLDGCTIIGLQELGTPADAEKLAQRLQTAYALDYEATALPGPQSDDDEFPLTNGLLVRAGRVRLLAAKTSQGCSPVDYGVVEADDPCATGSYPLFDRTPLVVDLAVNGGWGAPLPLRVVVNHWKSKGGDESINAPRRLAQAAHVVSLVQPQLEANPAAAIVVLGDLNDYDASAPVVHLSQVTRPPLVHTGDWLPPADRYTYIFNGGSQTLDHLLVSAGLAGAVAEVNVLHVNADFATPAQPEPASLRHVSDHDPTLLRIRPGRAAWLGGNLGYGGIVVQAMGAGGELLGSARTDDRGDFRLWNLGVGKAQLAFAAPGHLLLPLQVMTATLAAGGNLLELPVPAHRTVTVGVAAIRATLPAPAAPDETGGK